MILASPSAECAICGKPFVRMNTMQKVCGIRCARKVPVVARKQVAAADKARREAIKPRSKWMAEAQALVNRYCRLRDIVAGLGCVTCGAKPKQKRGGTMDAGHFRSVGSAPHIRFYTPQIRLQCVPCNRHHGGRALDFRKALVVERGSDWVARLESMQGTAKFDVAYLKRLKAVMAKRIKRLERRHEYRQDRAD